MGAGRILYEDWDCPKRGVLALYPCNMIGKAHKRLCVVTDLDLCGISSPVACETNQEDLTILTGFSNSLHSVIFGCEVVPTAFRFFFGVCGADNRLDMSFMRSVLASADLNLMDSGTYPTPPFIVHSTTSKRLHRVDQILNTEPTSFTLPTANWKPLAECGLNQQTLADYYMKKYGINVHEKQSIFVSPLGDLVVPEDLVPSKTTMSTNMAIPPSNPKNLLYLIPQLVRLSPLTEIIEQLRFLPRFLFWIERGIVAKDIAQTIGLDITVLSHDQVIFDKMVPSDFYHYESHSISLVSIALTCPGADLPYDYELLEWLGDSVLRTVVIDELKTSPQIINEVLSNDRMGRLCYETCPKIADRSVLSMRPSLRNPAACRSKLRNLRILADIVEALICASYVVGDIPGATRAAIALGLMSESEIIATTTPASVRLKQSLVALKNSDKSVSVGELDSMRNILVRDIHVSD